MFIRICVITLVIFLIIDFIWLGFISKNLYKKELGYIMSAKPNWIAAFIFYVIFVVGLVFFVIDPAIDKSSWTHALFAGMFFGLVAYATYDLTNMATIKDWPLKITLIDLCWGAFVSGSTSLLSYFINNSIK